MLALYLNQVKAYKKLPVSHKSIVNEAVRNIANNPKIGEEKKGDLLGVYVYKFKINHQQFLLAYEWDPALRVLLALGVHETSTEILRESNLL